MDVTLDYRLLRESNPLALVRYYRLLLSRYDDRSITDQLLAGVTSESLPPQVLSPWILGLSNIASVVTILSYEKSITVRRSAIRRAGKLLRSKKFPELWEQIGGSPGLLQIFAGLSVNEVHLFCRMIGRCATSQNCKDQRQIAVTEFLKSLACDYFAEASYKNPDKRPLLPLYMLIVPACTPDFALQWYHRDDELPAVAVHTLCRAFPTEFQKLYMQSIDRKDKDSTLLKASPLTKDVPPIPATPKLSESMRFSIQVLRALNSSLGFLKPQLILESLAYPLLRRLERRRGNRDLRAEIIELVLHCLKASDPKYNEIGVNSPLVSYTVRLWSRSDMKLNGLLASVFQAVQNRLQIPIKTLIPVLELVSPRMRYRLLGLLMEHLQYFGLDISQDDELGKIRELWPSNMFLVLSKDDALSLLDRLQRVHTSGGFLYSSGRGSDLVSIFDNFGDVPMLQSYLSAGGTDAFRRAKDKFEGHKKACTASRDKNERAAQARIAVFAAVVSRSLDLYEEALTWTRRFVRDYLTITMLYNPSNLSTAESVELLSAIPSRHNHLSTTMEKIAADVKQSNRILLSMLETACMALREPSFTPFPWSHLPLMITRVIEERLVRSTEIQDKRKFSDDQLYDAVWADTLDMLIKAEQIGLQDDNRGLGLNKIHGILKKCDYCTTEPRKAICRFFDSLAYERNELWVKYRRQCHPAVVSLQDPWTRGLPIQALLPFQIDSFGFGEHMPFLVSKADSIVFTDSSSALQEQPKNKETQTAIGVFVDDYRLALQFYVNAAPKHEQSHFVEKAWSYACDHLTKPEIEKEFRERFWKPIFESTKLRVQLTPLICSMAFPRVEDPTVPIEWDPTGRGEADENETSSGVTTCLDCLLTRSGTNHHVNSPYSFVNSDYSASREARRAWAEEFRTWLPSPKRYWSLQPTAREATVAFAALWINSQCPGFRILANPFPSTEDVRFPSLYLDGDFADPVEGYPNLDRIVIDSLQADFPTSLLVRLCDGMLDRLENPKHARSIETNTFNLIETLARSDRPTPAFDFVKRVIFGRPNDSSWHRMLLNEGFMNLLPARDATNFILDLLKAMVQTMRQQHETSYVPRQNVSAPSKSVLGVSTIKMLLNLMSATRFVNPGLATDILIEMFNYSHHIDVRVALVDCLASTLTQTKDRNLAEKIVGAFEKYAVPIAGSLNERKPIDESNWQAAELGGQLPELYAPDAAGVAPIYAALLEASSKGSTAVQTQMIERVLLPALRASTANHTRWTRLFLKGRTGHTLDKLQLPEVPAKPEMITLLLDKHLERLPRGLLDLWVEAALINLNPPQELREINDAIEASPEDRSSGAGKHWLALWNQDGVAAISWGGKLMTLRINTKFSSKVSDGITYGQIGNIILSLADGLVSGGFEMFDAQNWFFQTLGVHYGRAQNFQRDFDVLDHWSKYIRPLVEQIISKIENQRTPEWQKDPQRKPDALKDTYSMRLWLLNYREDREGRTSLGIFTDELLHEIELLAKDSRPYHQRLSILREAAMKRSSTSYCYLAFELGQPPASNAALSDYLRIDIADAYLRNSQRPDDQTDIIRARELLQSWKDSSDEIIRMRGFETMRSIRNDRRRSSWML